MKYEVMIIGGGIAGMESALTLGDMGYKVLLVEKDASIGGKMILLSKVFPTLDCASCISTPKMAATANHPNVDLLNYAEVKAISRQADGSFLASIYKKPTYVDPSKCTGCTECEPVCTVAIADEFNSDLIARRAAHIAFPQAVPKKAVLDLRGTSPCTFTCTAGVKPHGYISLVRAGKYDQAFHQHMEDAPLPGCLSRACYAPCEQECTRSLLEGPLSIRAIKRFMVDRYYSEHPEPEYGPPEKLKGKRVAIVGSGPAGLTAAYFLAKSGYSVSVFEGSSEPGGIMRWGIPSYRLPKDVLARDIKNITALGVTLKTASRIENLKALQKENFDAVVLAVGLKGGRKLSVEGEDLPLIDDAMDFLRHCNGGSLTQFKEKTVAVIGGGNVAIDCARSAIRLGAKQVRLICLESEQEMPAHAWEIRQAAEEGVCLHCSWGVKRFSRDGQSSMRIDLISCTSVFDEKKCFNPAFDASKSTSVAADFVISAIGLLPDTDPFRNELGLDANGKIPADARTLQTSIPNVFACGDAVAGPTSITEAIGHGKRAAFYVDRFLTGQPLDAVDFESRAPVVDRDAVSARAIGTVTAKEAAGFHYAPMSERTAAFIEFEMGLTEAQAREEANRCLDCGGCSQCGECVNTCPADAISFSSNAESRELNVGSIVIATGFQVFDAQRKPELGYRRFPNVIDAMQMDRILAPTRPYNAVIRPSDGKAPGNIAFILCTGSRDASVDSRLCSRVCCMYSLKQAQLLLGALPLTDVTIYYIDIRSFGKGYEEFYMQAQGMGIYFINGKVARIEETENQDLLVHYEDIENGQGMKTARHDLVVLSVGLAPAGGIRELFQNDDLELDPYSFIHEVDEDVEPAKTSVDGVYVAGAASASRDIPDTILHSGAAAAQVAAYLKKTGFKS